MNVSDALKLKQEVDAANLKAQKKADAANKRIHNQLKKEANERAQREFDSVLPTKIKNAIGEGAKYVYYSETNCYYFIEALAKLCGAAGFIVERDVYTPRDVEGNDIGDTNYSMRIRWEK